MAEPLPPLHDPERPDAWAVAYVDGTMSEADRASFAAHLQSHEECRALVETLRLAFPAFDRVLMEDGPPRAGAEYLAIARAAEAKAKAGTAEVAGPPHPASPPLGERGDSPAGASRVRRTRGPVWAWGAVFSGLTAVAASVLLVLQPFSAGLEPELLRAVESAPIVDSGPARPLPPEPAKLALSAAIHFGRLELGASRSSAEAYAAVALIDAKGRAWLVQTGDSSCAPDCGPLKLRVALDRLAPGPFRVAALLSAAAIGSGDFRGWLRDPNELAARWLGARAWAVVEVDR